MFPRTSGRKENSPFNQSHSRLPFAPQTNAIIGFPRLGSRPTMIPRYHPVSHRASRILLQSLDTGKPWNPVQIGDIYSRASLFVSPSAQLTLTYLVDTLPTMLQRRVLVPASQCDERGKNEVDRGGIPSDGNPPSGQPQLR
jgi:hypothetical protein